MLLIATGTATDQDIAAGYVVVTTLDAPTGTIKRYVTEIAATGLDVGHSIWVREGFSPVNISGPTSNGETAYTFENPTTVRDEDGPIEIAISDLSGLSTSVSWTWTVYEAEIDASDIPGSSDPETVNSYTYCLGESGPAEGVKIRYRLFRPPALARTFTLDDRETDASGIDGLVSVELFKNAVYEFWYGAGPRTAVDTTDADDPFLLPTLRRRT